MSDFIFSRQCVSEPLFLFVSGTSSCCICSLWEEGVVAHFLPTTVLCRQGQRSAQGCGCTVVLLGANILAHSSVSVVVLCLSKPLYWSLHSSFLSGIKPWQVHNSEAGIVQHTWSIAHWHAVAAGVVPSTHTIKLAQRAFIMRELLQPFYGHDSDRV